MLGPRRLSMMVRTQGQDGLDEVIELMEEYYLTKEELDSING